MIRTYTFALFLAAGLATAAAQNNASAQSGNDVCLTCHSDVADKLMTHAHTGVACQSCHVKHEDYPHPATVAKPACATCHSTVAKDYAHGVHGQALKKGNSAAPECGTCHGKAHELDSTKTAQFRTGIPDICGMCHTEIADQYKQSVHGQAVGRGITQAPVCTDCHGEHSILGPSNADSSVHSSHIRDTCASCHGDVRLTRRFGLPGDRVVSFDASFHGLATKAGAETVANCASCHGVHNIRASSDPKSTVNPQNLPATCGKCHMGAGRRFALGRVHLAQGEAEPPVLRWVRYIYLWIIPLTIGFMFLHNLGDWVHKLRRLRFNGRAPDAISANPISANHGTGELRMLGLERIQHAALAISFVVLAATGFALKYPDQWWAQPLLLWETARSTRGMVHRAASVVFMAAALAHIVSLIFNPPLRAHWRALWPGLQDWKEAARNFAYNLGLIRKFPGRSAHSYVEKAEYWALVWGSLVMVGTGLVLWGDNLSLTWLPKAVLDVATSIHAYEAILATLAILVWHFYFVIFDPDVYPMDSAWWTGRSPRPDFKAQTTIEGDSTQ
jgi:cytochrome b subunit of formate dehydrogenase